jgi:hypothetical protein
LDDADAVEVNPVAAIVSDSDTCGSIALDLPGEAIGG